MSCRSGFHCWVQLLPAVQKTSLTGSPFLLTVVDGTISCNLPDLYSSCFCLRFWPPFSSETLAGILKIKWPQPRQLKYRMSTAYAVTVRFALRSGMVPSDNVILRSVQMYTYIIYIYTYCYSTQPAWIARTLVCHPSWQIFLSLSGV